ncbi:MAG TPA: hypothetical protein PLL18_06040, partial [Flavobacteriales bacterium]|nr:hypothetical protein [Flavobacteriales bacterium]
MKRFSTLMLAMSLAAAGLFAQTSDLVVFSEAGDKFTLIVDGEVKNATPAARVVAQGIRNETPLLVVRFADAGMAELRQNGWLEFGKEYTIRVTTNKKGERVLRMQGVAELGTTKAPTEKPTPAQFVEDAPAQTGAVGTDPTGTVKSTTTITTTDGMPDHNINMNIG